MRRVWRTKRWAVIAAAAVLALGGTGAAIAATDDSKGGAMKAAGADQVRAQAVQTVDGKRYVSVPYINAPGATQFGNAMCPRTTEVVGGGAATSSSLQDINATHPIDSGDVGSAPEDGWRVWVQNNASQSRGVTIYAVCLP